MTIERHSWYLDTLLLTWLRGTPRLLTLLVVGGPNLFKGGIVYEVFALMTKYKTVVRLGDCHES